MLIYFLVLLFLSVATVLMTLKPSLAMPVSIAMAAMLCLLAGLRFETGFDWPAYLEVFDGGCHLGNPCFRTEVEPAYLWLNQAIKFVGGDFQTLLMIVAVFNIATIAFVASRISPLSQGVLWTVYFGLTFLPGQMGLERQSLASSFVLLALIATRWYVSAALILIGSSLQISVLPFTAVLLLQRYRPPAIFAGALVVVGLICAALHITFFDVMIRIASTFGLDYLSQKFAWYQTNGSVEAISTATMGVIALQLAILAALCWLAPPEEKTNRVQIIAVWLTLYMIFTHLFLAYIPSFWTRAILVALPWQIAALFQLRAVRLAPRFAQLAGVLVASMISASALYYYLISPTTTVFQPYNSLVQVLLSGQCGDGVDRSARMFASLRIPQFKLDKILPFRVPEYSYCRRSQLLLRIEISDEDDAS